MKLKRVTLGFENCEVVDIPADLVSYLEITGISTTQIYCGTGEIESFLQCNDCEIHILREAGNIQMEWDGIDGPQNLAKRLAYRDITNVDLDYGDRVDSYHVKWPDGSEYVNENMTVADEGDEIRISIC